MSNEGGYQKWLGRRFWNQTFEEALAPKKGQSPEQEVQEIRQLLNEEARVDNISRSSGSIVRSI